MKVAQPLTGATGADHRETADAYSGVLFRQGRYRVAVCRDGIQWLFQRQRPRYPAGRAVWDKDTAAKALWELQAHGFLVPTQIGSLGVSGEGRATLWRLTELGTPSEPIPSKDYVQWQPGRDFQVQRGKAPSGKKQKPVPPGRTSCPLKPDVVPLPCPTAPDVLSHQIRRTA